MPASLGPAPGSMASLSIDESSTGGEAGSSPPGGHAHLGPAGHAHLGATPSLDTATPTVPVIPSSTQTEKSPEFCGGAMGPASPAVMDESAKDEN